MDMTQQNLRQFRTDFAEAVKELEDKYDISIDLGHITYDMNSFTCKMTVLNGSGSDINEKKWNDNCWKFGLHTTDLNRIVWLHNERCQIIGIQPSSRKYPIIIKRLKDNAEFKYTADAIVKAIDKEEDENES